MYSTGELLRKFRKLKDNKNKKSRGMGDEPTRPGPVGQPSLLANLGIKAVDSILLRI
ncbi:hypothetical protein Csa_013928 [Cucumis sativus]|uniref:Uncharacterized protein n=1 Tax=Cucumis sativus TaxID=3659 RepID=A0A0A0LPC2_CUCSA|nr:hypothetical protein Csa_013928 [Cucumis sativus]